MRTAGSGNHPVTAGDWFASRPGRREERLLDTTLELRPTIRYRRQLEGADFSLEANTPSVPAQGHFYVLDRGHVVLRSDDFAEAIGAYHELCRGFWSGRLESQDPSERMASAWGLVGLDPGHRGAAEVIRREGTAADVKRLEQLRRRSYFARKGGARGRGTKARG